MKQGEAGETSNQAVDALLRGAFGWDCPGAYDELAERRGARMEGGQVCQGTTSSWKPVADDAEVVALLAEAIFGGSGGVYRAERIDASGTVVALRGG
jgi:hypothetical protein